MKNRAQHQEKCQYSIILSGTVIAIFLVLADSAFSRPAFANRAVSRGAILEPTLFTLLDT
jgi:hypothetical protein